MNVSVREPGNVLVKPVVGVWHFVIKAIPSVVKRPVIFGRRLLEDVQLSALVVELTLAVTVVNQHSTDHTGDPFLEETVESLCGVPTCVAGLERPFPCDWVMARTLASQR
ncbi:MAG: hypothetical protein OXD33_02780 [Rhodobacteraceae bacterium]|nr:hypothetical protein [Paracoccaceae bacterium]